MSDYIVSEQDVRKTENIRRQYVSREENKIEQLRRLDGKVKAPGKIAAGVLGAAGSLIMGAGMSLVMVWGNMTTGLILGIPGLVAMILAYPLYAVITGSRKKKYADEMMKLSDDVIRR